MSRPTCWASPRLPAQLRYEGAALISLLRNLVSAIGISIFEALVTRSTQVEHSVLAPIVSPLNRALAALPSLSAATPHGAAVLQMINYQAQVIAYNNDYRLTGLLALPLLVLLPFMTRPQRDRGGHAAVTRRPWTDNGPVLAFFHPESGRMLGAASSKR